MDEEGNEPSHKRQKVSHDDEIHDGIDAMDIELPPSNISFGECKESDDIPSSRSQLSSENYLVKNIQKFMEEIKDAYEFVKSDSTEELTNQRKVLLESDYCMDSDSIVYSTSLPSKPDYNLRWIERVASYYIPSASFTYEVQYPSPRTLPVGFTVQWQYIPYSAASPAKTILCCVVKSVQDAFQHSIMVGDVILKMNDEVLVYKPGDAVDKKKIDNLFTETFKSSISTNSIRFLRAGSTCNGCVPSVAEILLLINEKSVGAKYHVKMQTKDGQEAINLELIQMDNQLPNAVKKLLQSQKINWQQIPVLSIGSAQANYLISANITPQLNSIASSVIGSMTLNYTTPTYNIHSASLEDIMRPDHSDKYIRSGIYRDKAKFVVIYVDRKNSMSHLKRRVRYSSMASSSTTGEDDKSPPKIYNLGRYDTEEEAKRVYQKASYMVKTTGTFNLKHFLLGLSTTKKEKTAT